MDGTSEVSTAFGSEVQLHRNSFKFGKNDCASPGSGIAMRDHHAGSLISDLNEDDDELDRLLENDLEDDDFPTLKKQCNGLHHTTAQSKTGSAELPNVAFKMQGQFAL